MKKIFCIAMVSLSFSFLWNCQASFPGVEGQKWTLQSHNNKDVLKGSVASVTFSRGQVFGTAGCNPFSGVFKVTKAKIQIQNIETTKRPCLSNKKRTQEKLFLSSLTKTTSYSIKADKLILNSEGGILIFHKAIEVPNLPLHQTHWKLSSIIDGKSVMTPATGFPIFMKFNLNTFVLKGCSQPIPGRYLLRGKTFRVKLDTKGQEKCNVNLKNKSSTNGNLVLETIKNATKIWIVGDVLSLRTATGTGLEFVVR